MGARYIQRPENALKRANEFIDVGKPARALDTLQEVFRNKKWTYTWSESVIEPIMFKYLDLCVELKKSHIAKEGLFQYRNMFQLVNVGSLENVIRGYLKMAEKRTEAAQQQSSEAVLDIDDLDNLTTPESILMSAVCGEDAQDRSDRTILLPWVKFLWESYCQCLELLRINSHCEQLYHDIARMAFQFCLKYNRKMEFRKLCEKLRKHLDDISKPTTQTTNVSITRPETQQLNLETRLHQLESAIQMELWQEAYKAIEDIHGLMVLSKKTPQAKTMANYYQKLAMVFWKAGNKLFHAAALLKFFQLSKEMKKNITPEELQRLASHVLVATVAIPVPSAHPEFDRFIETDKSPLEKAQRLAVLLGLQQPPTRVSLLKEVVRLNVVTLADPHLQNLYKWLEVEFDPLQLCNRVQSIVDYIGSDEQNHLNQYVAALHHITLVRLVRQISQVYQSVEFSRILDLAKFTNTFYLERILVDCVRHNDMQITIDHKRKCIHFGTELTESQREHHPDGPMLQSMPSEQIRSQLVNMSVVLHRAIVAIDPNHKKADREQVRVELVKHYNAIKEKAHEEILLRQKIIEDRKEYIERLNTEREEEELRRQEEAARQAKIAEQKRLEQEMEERQRKRQENEIAQIKQRNFQAKVQQYSQTSIGRKVLAKLDTTEEAKIDPEQLAAIEIDQLAKERKELASKLKSQEKKVDYFERAKRLEEIPLIEKYLADKQVQDKEFWEKQEAARIEAAIAERKIAVATQERLKRMYAERDQFLEQLRTERKSDHVEKLKRFELFLEEEKRKRLAQRKVQRREERRQAWLREKEEERLKREEEARKKREEEERIEREKREAQRAIEMEKLRLQSEKQRQKEEEAERKLQAEREKYRDEKAASRPERTEERGWRNAPAKAADDAPSDWRARPAPAAASAAAPAATGAANNADGAPPPTAAAPAGGKNVEPWRPKSFRMIDTNDSPEKWRRGGAPPDDDRRRDDRPIERRPRDDAPRGMGREDGPIRRHDDEPIRRADPDRRAGDERPPPRDRGFGPREDGERRGFGRDGDRGGYGRDRGGYGRDRGGDKERDNFEWRRPRHDDDDKDQGTNWRNAGPPRDRRMDDRRGDDRRPPPRTEVREADKGGPREESGWRDVKRR